MLTRLGVTAAILGMVLVFAGPAQAQTQTTHTASADAHTRADIPSTPTGSATLLHVDGSPIRRSLLRFEVPAGNPISDVRLRVYIDFSTGEGYQVAASSCDWAEGTVTYNTAPAPGAQLASRSTDPIGWNEFVLPTSSVAGGGPVCFQLVKAGPNWMTVRSREHTANVPPTLVLTRQDAPPPSPPTATGHTASPNPALTTDTIQFAIQGSTCPGAPCTYQWAATAVTVGTPQTITWSSTTPSSSRSLPAGRWNIRPTITDSFGQVANRIPPDPLTIDVNAPPPPPPPAGDLFVAPNGSGTSNCTQAAPCTPSRANAIVQPGQVVSVACGAYGSVSLTRGGTSSARVTWVAAQKWCARFSASSACSGSAVSMSAQHVTFRGFEVTRGRVSVAITGSNTSFNENWVHDVFLGCTPTGSGAAAIDAFTSNYVPMSNVTIDRNLVHSVGSTPVGQAQTTQGIYIASPCPGCPVTNNVIWGVEDFGIHGYHNACSWKVVNNTSVGNGRGILVGPQSVRRNNISAFNKGNGWQVSSATSCSGGAVTSNNTSWGNGNNNATTGITVADPLFVSHAGRDYHLQAGSPAVDTGTSTDAPLVDHDGASRPQGAGFDRGAYER